MKGWQSTFDNLTRTSSFYETDFTKLYEICINPEFSFYLKREVTSDGGFYGESKGMISKSLKVLQKHFTSEIALVDNKHVKKFFTNLIKYSDIEHLYLLSLPNDFDVDRSRPNIMFSLDRFFRMIKDIHLVLGYADSRLDSAF
jgi:hypothetical protein